ncbi:MAG: DNA polymerase III subunit delta, partial [Pseudolabrys sp.]|nr:DNA polymerase III subunit delta [Pseudolabrys sp.]
HVARMMREAGLAIAPDARDMLATLLGADRLASRSELRKLATFAAGKATVTIDDIVAVVSDASAEALDSVVDAAFAGQPAELETEFKKARNAGSNPAAIVGAALRQSAQLHRMRLALDSGDSIDNVMMRGRPPVHFSRKQRVETALRAWNAARLETAMGQLAAATLETRRQPGLAETIAQRTLLSMAAEARRRN